MTYETRVQATQAEVGPPGAYDVPDDCPPEGCTPDEQNFPVYAASFHKLLPHDANGLLTDDGTSNGGVRNYRRLLKGLKVGTPSSDFDTHALNTLTLLNRHPTDPPGARPRVLINPRSSKSLSIKGPDIVSLDVGSIVYGADYTIEDLLDEISLSSGPSAAEMIELYAMALLRGLPFDQYQNPPGQFAADVDLAIAALNEFGADFIWGYPDFARFTAADLPVDRTNLFRGATPGARAGSFLSVFLLFKRPPLFPSGCAPHVADLIGAGQFADLLGQDLLVPQGQDKDFGLTLAAYAAIQNADVPEKYPKNYFSPPGALATGRNLGDYVHVDNAYEEHIRAADILVGHQYPRSPHSPYSPFAAPAGKTNYPNEGDGPTLGPGDAWGLVGGVRVVAERAAWAQKYLVARRARPEVMAALLHLAKNGRTDLQALLDSRLFTAGSQVDKFLERVKAWNQSRAPKDPNYSTYLLPQMYPEGSPAHPSWPSGHATVAGACVTVLKAIFDDCHFIIDPKSPPGKPQPFPSANEPLYVHDELDKLATNVAFGRNFGGVHYRSDGEHGILLGEEVAIRYLQDHLREYREHFRNVGGCAGFALTRRNGTRICITADGVCPTVECPAPKEARIHPKAQL